MADEQAQARVEKGREIIKSRAAQGEPGQKQPAHSGPAVEAQQVIDDLNAVVEKHAAETRGPSAGETKNHPVPPQDRSTRPVTGGGIQAAAGAVAAARAHIENELVADARIASDPRHELDQKKFEMGQRGELAFVPPAPEELAARGIDKDVADEIPKTPQEQVARDMPRLEQAAETAKQVRSGEQINPAVESAVRDSQTRTGQGKATVASGADRPDTAPTPAAAPAAPSPGTPAVGTGGTSLSGGENASGGGTPIK